MLLYGILEVDEKFQTITNHVWIQMHWANEYLKWTPSEHCGIDKFTYPKSMLWVPDICILEDASDTGSVLEGPQLTVHYSGIVTVAKRQRLTFTCQLNMKMFPFDRQHCNLTFKSQSSDFSSIMLGTVFNETSLAALSSRIMITQGEWKLTDVSIERCHVMDPATNQCRLTYMVVFERKPMLYVINFIVPLFYLLILDLTSFFISEARGEKMSFKVTILLSISVLLLILQDMLPSTEENLPMIAIYCVSIFALVGLSVLEAMLVTFLVDLDGYCAAQRTTKVLEDIPVDSDYIKDSAGMDEKVQVNSGLIHLPLASVGDPDLLQLILDEVKAARRVSGNHGKEKRKYKNLAEIIDHIYFFFYFFTVAVFLLYMYFEWISNLN